MVFLLVDNFSCSQPIQMKKKKSNGILTREKPLQREMCDLTIVKLEVGLWIKQFCKCCGISKRPSPWSNAKILTIMAPLNTLDLLCRKSPSFRCNLMETQLNSFLNKTYLTSAYCSKTPFLNLFWQMVMRRFEWFSSNVIS